MENFTQGRQSIVKTFNGILQLSKKQGSAKYIGQLEQFATTDLDLI